MSVKDASQAYSNPKEAVRAEIADGGHTSRATQRLRLHLRPSPEPWANRRYRPSVTIDRGASVTVEWGTTDFALTPGVHSLYIETSARHTGAAQATVHLSANAILELHYSAPMLGQFQGALGLTPQKTPYRRAYALLLGLALLILVISVILWPS